MVVGQGGPARLDEGLLDVGQGGPARLDLKALVVGQGGERRLKEMRYFIYILKSVKFEKTYVGFTDNLDRRLKEHNSGKTHFTKIYMPWEILYTEEVETREEARAREKYYKSSAGRRFIKNKILFNAPVAQ